MSHLNEQFQNPDASTLDDGFDATDFDWDSLYETLGETDTERDQALARAGDGLHQILKWACAGDLKHPKAIQRVAKKIIAATWVINPDFFNGSSLAQVADKLGFSPANVSPFSAAFSREFRIRNRGQNHDWRNREESKSV